MAGDSKKLQPIIVKRVKKGGHGAHGGACKIAYADFVRSNSLLLLIMGNILSISVMVLLPCSPSNFW